MPSIASRTTAKHPDEVTTTPPPGRLLPPLSGNAAPILSTTLRCPMPFSSNNAGPDNLRQYYNGGVVPQYRFTPPSPLK